MLYMISCSHRTSISSTSRRLIRKYVCHVRVGAKEVYIRDQTRDFCKSTETASHIGKTIQNRLE
jgi:hypothetical protein